MCSEYSDAVDLNIVKAVVICKRTGDCLLDVMLNSEINPVLLSGFVSALSMFGDESFGKIKDISINGLDIDMLIIPKDDLIMVVIMDKAFVKEHVREEAMNMLEAFVILYDDDIKNAYFDSKRFKDFENVITSHVNGLKQRKVLKCRDIVVNG